MSVKELHSINELPDIVGMEVLNDDCLIHVFSFLAIIDRIRIQRVCQRWRLTSQISFQSIKYFRMTPNFWGINKNSSVIIDRNIFGRVLGKCGSSLIGINVCTDSMIRVQPSKTTFSIIHELCPNIKSISVTFTGIESATHYTSTIQYIADNFRSLANFKIENMTRQYDEDSVSLLFSNNPKLRHYEMINCCFLDHISLSNLNFQIIEEFHLHQCLIRSSKHLIEILQQFRVLHTLRFTCCIIKEKTWINSFLEGLSYISRHLENLNLHFCYTYSENIQYTYLSSFKNLKKLCLRDNQLVNDEVMAIIASNCRGLTELQLYNSEIITDEGILSIRQLTQLQILSINELNAVTDQALGSLLSLKRLECCRCPSIRKEGLLNLLHSPASIELIKLNCCESLSVCRFIDSVIKCRREQLEIVIDTSEIENNLIKCVFTLCKRKDSVVKKVKKICFKCFKKPYEHNKANDEKPCIHCCDIEEVL